MAKWHTLQTISLHLPDYLLSFLNSYVEGCTSTVHLKDSVSTPKPTPSGLPQGVILSTTLFFLYLSNMLCPLHTCLVFCSDDPALLSQSWRPETVSHRLSNAVTTLLKYFTMWKLWLNIKLKSFYFPRAVSPSRIPFKSRTSLCPGPWLFAI